MKQPLVSVIVPTKNSSVFLKACLQSIQDQDYPHIELIVVDNSSTDDTKKIAKQFTDKVYNKGPERSTQRNYGVKKSAGEYVAIIDSDMVLSQKVISSCIDAITANNNARGVIIPEESFGEGFWAQCKKLERSFYVGIDWMEAARFFPKEFYLLEGGYDEELVSGEDWDLSQRIATHGKLVRTQAYIGHNEGHLRLRSLLRKKYYYAKKFRLYTQKYNTRPVNVSQQTGVITRYKLFFRQPVRLLSNPIVGVGMLILKTGEFAVGGIGYVLAMAVKSE